MRRYVLGLAVLASFFGVATLANAAMVGITNPGFEAFVLADGQFTRLTNGGNPNEINPLNPIPDWTVTANNAGTFNPTSSQATAPEGVNVAYSNSPSISQVLAALLTANTVYTLEVEVGRRLEGGIGFPGYSVQLLAGGTLLAEDPGTLSPPLGSFLTSTVPFTALSGNPLLGTSLEIRLLSSGVQTLYDDVRLDARSTVSPIPEPGTLLLIGSGLVGSGVGARRRNRRK